MEGPLKCCLSWDAEATQQDVEGDRPIDWDVIQPHSIGKLRYETSLAKTRTSRGEGLDVNFAALE